MANNNNNNNNLILVIASILFFLLIIILSIYSVWGLFTLNNIAFELEKDKPFEKTYSNQQIVALQTFIVLSIFAIVFKFVDIIGSLFKWAGLKSKEGISSGKLLFKLATILLPLGGLYIAFKDIAFKLEKNKPLGKKFSNSQITLLKILTVYEIINFIIITLGAGVAALVVAGQRRA